MTGQSTSRAILWTTRHRAWIAVACAIVLLISSHIFPLFGVTIPLYWEDEAGYLGNAQVLAGVGDIPDLRGRPYYIGWSLLLVPLWWIFQDGEAVYRGAVVLSALCGIALAVPLTLIARRFRLSWPWAIVAGAVIAASPARTLLSGFGLPENLLALLVAFTVLLAMRFHESPTVSNALGLGLVAAAAFTTHGRVIPVLVATALWLVWNLRRNLIPALAGLGSMAIVAGGFFLIYRNVTSLIYGSDGARESVGIGRILDASFLPTVMSGTGQIWYLVVCWVGLTVPGFVVIGRQLAVEWRARTPGIALWAALGLFGTAIISFTNISSAIARGSSRIDVLSYGRYLEPLIIPIALIGLVAVIRGLSLRMALAMLVVTVLVSAAWFAIVWPNIQTVGTRWWAPINVTGLLHFGFHTHTVWALAPWLPASIAIIAATALIVVLRKRVVILVIMLSLYFAAATVFSETRVIYNFFGPWKTSFTLKADIDNNPLLDGLPVSFDMHRLAEVDDIASKNAYQILLAPRSVPIYDSIDGPPSTDLVISRHDWEFAEKFGARAIAVDTGVYDSVLWVLPGQLQDALAAAGELLPVGGQ
jgi:hypothetical protein